MFIYGIRESKIKTNADTEIVLLGQEEKNLGNAVKENALCMRKWEMYMFTHIKHLTKHGKSTCLSNCKFHYRSFVLFVAEQ